MTLEEIMDLMKTNNFILHLYIDDSINEEITLTGCLLKKSSEAGEEKKNLFFVTPKKKSFFLSTLKLFVKRKQIKSLFRGVYVFDVQ